MVRRSSRTVTVKYDTYIDGLERFRRLQPSERREILKDVFGKRKLNTCLNEQCPTPKKQYKSVFALNYHLDRCGLDESNAPWRCWRCGYNGVKSESAEHLSQHTSIRNPRKSQRRSSKVEEDDKEEEEEENEEEEEAEEAEKDDGSSYDAAESVHSAESDSSEGYKEASASEASNTSETKVRNVKLDSIGRMRRRSSRGKRPKEMPTSSDRNDTVRKKYKLSTFEADSASGLNHPQIRAYIDAIYGAYVEFLSATALATKLAEMNAQIKEWQQLDKATRANCNALSRWRDTRSLRMLIRNGADAKQLKDLFKPPWTNSPGFCPKPSSGPAATELVDLPFLRAERFAYTTNTMKPNAFMGIGVANYTSKTAVGEAVAEVAATFKRKGRPPKNSSAHQSTPTTSKNTTTEQTAPSQQPMPTSGVVLNCGGPMAAVAWCPQSANAAGNELLAVSTFVDEVDLIVPSSAGDERDASTFIQLWTVPPLCASTDAASSSSSSSPATRNASCRALIAVRNATVLDLAWCPLIVGERPSTKEPRKSSPSRKSKNTSRIEEDESTSIGLLAAATSRGTILVYRIPKDILNEDDESPPYERVYNVESSAILVLPAGKVAEKAETAGENEDANDKATPNGEIEIEGEEAATTTTTIEHESPPLGSLVWSCYGGGGRLVAVSDAGRVHVWTLDDDDDKAKIGQLSLETDGALKGHLADGIQVRRPAWTLDESDWDSPANAVTWISKNEIIITLRSRTICLYGLEPTLELLFRDSTPKSVGLGIKTPTIGAVLPGFLTFDTLTFNLDGIKYAGTTYMVLLRDEKSLFVTPTPNLHQCHTFDAAICARSGIVSTVGIDGRLHQSLVGRVHTDIDARDAEFAYGRSILQLLRFRDPASDTPKTTNGNAQQQSDANGGDLPPPVHRRHADCRSGSWLEVRVGDAALLDSLTMKKQRYQAPEALLDRRTESLNRVAASALTAGKVAAGGEAGLVFIMPTQL